MYKQYDPEVLKKVQSVQKEILHEFGKFCDEYNLNYFLIFGTALGAVRHKGFIPWDDDIDVGMLREDYDRFLSLLDQFDKNYEVLTPILNKNYCSTVTHLQKKGTKFVSEYAKDMKCDLGINIDIFVYDKILDNSSVQKKQMRNTYFWGRLLFLRGSGHPEIPIKGMIGVLAKAICLIVHYMLVLFRISPKWIYKQLLKKSTMYNNSNSQLYTSFEDATPWKNIIKFDEIFPLKVVPFEDIYINIPNKTHEILTRTYGNYMEIPPIDKRVNHSPIILDFGDENENN